MNIQGVRIPVSSNRRNQRRQEQRRQRQTRRREIRTQTIEEAGPVEFSGPMGFMQRHIKSFFLFGIIFMVLSLGGVILTSLLGPPETNKYDSPTSTSAVPKEPAAKDVSEDVVVRWYESPPEMAIDLDIKYEAILRLDSGIINIDLFAEESPELVNNFIFLARNSFYDGLIFHRVVPGFVAQAGDPSGDGYGSPGYTLSSETNALTFSAGSLSMARDAIGTVNGSQFFITLGSTPHLNADFTVFGKVKSGLEILDNLQVRDPTRPGLEAAEKILNIEIIEK